MSKKLRNEMVSGLLLSAILTVGCAQKSGEKSVAEMLGSGQKASPTASPEAGKGNKLEEVAAGAKKDTGSIFDSLFKAAKENTPNSDPNQDDKKGKEVVGSQVSARSNTPATNVTLSGLDRFNAEIAERQRMVDERLRILQAQSSSAGVNRVGNPVASEVIAQPSAERSNSEREAYTMDMRRDVYIEPRNGRVNGFEQYSISVTYENNMPVKVKDKSGRISGNGWYVKIGDQWLVVQ